MAARVLLLGILFTEVLEPVCAAGVRGTGNNLNGRNGLKRDNLDLSLTKSTSESLRIEPERYVVLGKRGVTLNCLSKNINDVSWLYNGESAPPCGIARCDVLENGSLHFFKKQNLQLVQKTKDWNTTVGLSKKHEYRCIGRTNSGGFLRSAPTFIQIAELSHNFKQSLINLTVNEGEIARLSCLIDSVPFPPNITWLHNGELILSDRNNTKYSMVPPGVLYVIATKQSDAGFYRCIATNDFIKKTKKSKEAKLTVIPRLDSKKHEIPVSLFPQVSYHYSLIYGSHLILVCAASGYPLPLITWSFVPQRTDGANVEQSRILLNSTRGISVLTLKNVSIYDAGTYLCSTENPVSGMEIQNITVDVAIPPSFVKKPTNQMCPNGRTARFECQVEGTPTPQIYWLKDAENITITGRRTTYMKENNKMELAISATVPSDSGDYQCVAVNSAGEIWAAGRLQVNASRNSPLAPTSLKCNAQSPVKITISWSPPKSLPSTSITAYTVHYSPAEGGKEEVSPEPGNSTSVEVTKLLEPYTNYSFYVRVWNNHGASDQSATIICATAPSIPKTAPKIHVDILSSTKINVTWCELTKKEARGIIVGYKLQWRLHEHPSSRVIFVPANNKHYILTGLLPGAQYDLRVLARTELGWPNIGESQLGWIKIVMPTIDSNDYNMKNILDIEMLNINGTHLIMKWKIRNDDNINNNNNNRSNINNNKSNINDNNEALKFDSWQIYCENVNGDKLFNVTLSKESTEYIFDNLQPNVSYTIGLCIINNNISSDCISKTVKSIRHYPGNVPMSLEAIPLSSTSIKITWTMINSTDIDEYEICYKLVQSTDVNSSNCIFVNETKAIIEKLKPFTLYQFKVRPFQRDYYHQNNEFSESIECYTSEDVPGKPDDVQGYANGTRIRINWREPIKTNGMILTYFISYYSSDFTESSMSWGNMTVSGNKTSVLLPELSMGGRYYIMVQAATKAGYGRPSNPILVYIGGNNSKIPTLSDKREPPVKPKPDQSLGVILGVGISIGFVVISLCSIYCRKKWEHARSLRESGQPLKNRIITRNGNACCIDRSSTSMNQQANHQIAFNEIELAVLCPSTPTPTNNHSNAKVTLANGIVDACAKEPLLTTWDLNDENKDLHIMENPQYKQKNSPVSIKQTEEDDEDDENDEEEEEEEEENMDEDEDDADLDATELTMIDCTLIDSDSSLNNNLNCSTSSPCKIITAVVPILEPNG
ncbi:hypothetical protein PV327_010374 [Microctonus hyperodae]|uniref:Protogenin n=1 Tax=Microctonus hyperodae TaxID=165561 RepID=A0AA39FSA9_MICHY|nr:hypothetical protein PV327_010374 [Microctonus hyperodae]